MFNSLLGWASLNHLHFHCYSFPSELVLDNLNSIQFHGSVRMTHPDYPLSAFVINVSSDNIESSVKNIGKVKIKKVL